MKTLTLKEYLKQDNPCRMPRVLLNKKQYKIAQTYNHRGELRHRVYVITKNKIVSGIEYCLIGKSFYTTDTDGNPKNRSVFFVE
jgi:hypothetical protein